MNKIRIDMLSKADSVEGQGVGSFYKEHLKLMKEFGKEDFETAVNKRTKKYDLVHVHSINPSFYFKLKKNISITHVHFLPDTFKGSIKLPRPIFYLFNKYVLSFYRKSKELVVVNPSYIESLTKLGIEKDRITYIPNFVSERDFHPVSHEDKYSLRKKYGIDTDSFVVCSVGQIQTRKGVDDFLKVAEMNPDMKFIWLGGFSFKQITDGYKNLKKEIEKKRDNVIFPGIVERKKMLDYYNMSDVFFLPSYDELFPMSILEACSAEIPVLVRDLPVYEPILPSQVLKGKDVESFSCILRRLRKDKELRFQSEDISRQIKRKYSRRNIYEMWYNYYHRIYKKYNS